MGNVGEWVVLVAGILIIGAGLCLVGSIPGRIAKGKQHEKTIHLLGMVGIFVGFLWLIALIWAFCDRGVEESAAWKRLHEARRYPCPSCQELIVRGAKKCHFCGEVLPAQLAAPLNRPRMGRRTGD